MKSVPIAFSLLALAVAAHARPNSYDAAVSVVGQPGLTSNVASIPPSAQSLYNPDGVAIDPTTGKLFVSDTGNHRILRFSAAAAYQTNPVAEAIFGQANAEFGGANRGNPGGTPSRDSFDTPANLCFDAQGTLWVADYGNARVLRFDNASVKESFTAEADGVIGQADFTSDTAAANSVADGGFSAPSGIAIDGAGRLWVSDGGIPRILRFDNAADLPYVAGAYDGSADGYLGETSGELVGDPVDTDTFDSATVMASSFGSDLWGLCVDPDGDLWVADATNNRVLFFKDPATAGNGADAIKVLGQAGFTDGVAGSPVSAMSLNGPYYLNRAPDGTLWVSDYLNHRLLGFLNPEEKENGDPADLVLGQPDFLTSDQVPANARDLNSPTQIAFGINGSLFVGQYLEGGRIKRWSDPVTIVAPRARRATKRGIAVLRGFAAGAAKVEYLVPGQGGYKLARGSATVWTVRVTRLKRKLTNVTVRSVAFDGRVAVARVKVSKPG